MKQLQVLFFSMMMGVAFVSHALDQDVQVDLLMAKIINAQKESRAADALPSMAKLESMEPTLKAPLPESFHFLYITTLDETGDHANALRRVNIYIEKFGRGGKNYAKVIDIMSRLEEEADKNAKADIAKCEDLKMRFCRKLKAYNDTRNSDFNRSKKYQAESEEIEREANGNRCKWSSFFASAACEQ
jgi:hypothetical protein